MGSTVFQEGIYSNVYTLSSAVMLILTALYVFINFSYRISRTTKNEIGLTICSR